MHIVEATDHQTLFGKRARYARSKGSALDLPLLPDDRLSHPIQATATSPLSRVCRSNATVAQTYRLCYHPSHQEAYHMESQTPPRAPAIRAITHDDVGGALARLIPIAMPATRAAETGASAKAADFLLAWWNGDNAGHFPVLHLCNVDATIAEDMLVIMAYLAENSTAYADQWGYREVMGEMWERYR
jgi:hypothetical protein